MTFKIFTGFGRELYTFQSSLYASHSLSKYATLVLKRKKRNSKGRESKAERDREFEASLNHIVFKVNHR